jgi:hypothetical protein
MEKFITDERTGLEYELVGDYYIVAGEDEPTTRTVGLWGQRHSEFIRKNKRLFYAELLTKGLLGDYLSDVDMQAEAMFNHLVAELAKRENITEKLKADDMMLWVQKMNNVRSRAREIVNSELIYI